MRRILCTTLTATLLAGAALAPAPAVATGDEPSPALRSYRKAVRDALAEADPGARLFFQAVDDAVAQATDDRIRVTWHRGVDDLTGDGVRDVLLERWRFSIDSVGFGFTGDYRAVVVDGRRGSRLWTYDDAFQGGFPLLALRIRLAGGAPGLLFQKIDNQSAESPTFRLTFDAFDAAGEPVWTRTFTSTFNLVTGGTAATDVPLTFDRFEPDGDEATEFLVGLTDYVKTAVPDRAVARTDVFVFDGADGSLTPLGTVGPDLYWFQSVQAGPDIDGRGGDDFVVAGNENSPDSYLEVRSGLSGEVVWRTAARLGWYPWATGVPDMTSDGRRDLLVGWDRPNTNERVFQLWDAQKARPLWKAGGVFPYLLGDQDRDGTIDIGAFEFVRSSRRQGARFLAFSRGRLLYRKTHVEQLPSCENFCFSGGFYLDGGDVDDDSLRDTYVLASIHDGDRSRVIEYAVAGADGKLLYRRRHLAPVLGTIGGDGGDDLLGFARRRGGGLRITAYDGATRAPLWSRSYRMAGLLDLGPYGPYGTAIQLDRDAEDELLVTFGGEETETLAALDGATGRILWQRATTGDARVRAARS